MATPTLAPFGWSDVVAGGAFLRGKAMGIARRAPHDLAYQMQRLVNRLAREMRRQNAGASVSSAAAMLLAEVKRAPGVGVAQLAAMENIGRSATSVRVKNLQAAGLIATDPQRHTDRRRIGLIVTASGRCALEEIDERRRKWMAERLAVLSPAELDVVQSAVTLLDRFVGRQKGT